jgi:hypothetical protein
MLIILVNGDIVDQLANTNMISANPDSMPLCQADAAEAVSGGRLQPRAEPLRHLEGLYTVRSA